MFDFELERYLKSSSIDNYRTDKPTNPKEFAERKLRATVAVRDDSLQVVILVHSRDFRYARSCSIDLDESTMW